MSVKRVLREACALIQRSHVAPPPGRPLLAVDKDGGRCEPLSPAAVAWTSVGALYVVDPLRLPDRDTHGEDGLQAYELLAEAVSDTEFPVETYKEAARHLRRPFTQAAVKFKVQATWPKDNPTGGLIVAYIDARLTASG
jgi:hypothetical protein